MRILATISLFFTLLIISITGTGAQSSVSYGAGAVGDLTTVRNLGVGVSIQTHAYDIDFPDLPGRADAFWVGVDLASGGFIQFGYSLQAGYSCLKGFYESNHTFTCQGGGEDMGNGDPRWFWEYYPKLLGDVYYFQTGPSMSGGVNGTWHTYRIADIANQSWSFILDGAQVSSLNVTPSLSTTPPHEVAEQVTAGSPGRLGPVEFRNLSYFRSGVWRPVEFLRPILSCGLTGACSVPNPYNVTFLGENDMLAGSLNPPHPPQVKSSPQTYSIYFITAGVFSIVFLILIANYAKKGKGTPASHPN